MGLFRPYERSERKPEDEKVSLTPKTPKPSEAEEASETVAGNSAAPKANAKKDTPTPTRKAAEAARMERLHPTLSKKEARRKNRAASRARADENWQKTENSPERALARNYVDARWTAVEFVLPGILVFLALTMATSSFPTLLPYVTLALWAFLAVCIFNMIFLWRGFRRQLAERLPKASRRGLLMYLLNRAMMIRRFRQPGPAIRRGDKY